MVIGELNIDYNLLLGMIESEPRFLLIAVDRSHHLSCLTRIGGRLKRAVELIVIYRSIQRFKTGRCVCSERAISTSFNSSPY